MGIDNKRNLGPPGLGHPRRQLRARAIGLFDKVIKITTIAPLSQDLNPLTGTRVIGIMDGNFKTLSMGSMCPTWWGWARAIWPPRLAIAPA